MGSVLTLPTFLLGWGAVRWGGGGCTVATAASVLVLASATKAEVDRLRSCDSNLACAAGAGGGRQPRWATDIEAFAAYHPSRFPRSSAGPADNAPG